MHPEVLEWVRRFATDEPVVVLDIGGRDMNGSCRALFPNSTYVSLDIADGCGVDVVADAATWVPDRAYDVVVCAEVFEHTPVWPAMCGTAYAACRPGGVFVVTCAGPGRHPHSGRCAGPLQPGEYYRNLDVADLRSKLEDAGFGEVQVRQSDLDLQASAVRSPRRGWV